MPDATAIISTKDRRKEVVRAVRSVVRQTAEVEVILFDDGSSDGTAEAVAAEFPGVRVVRYEESAGSLARRNEGARLASAPVLISLDDDAELLSPETVEQVIEQFSDHVGAVAIPFWETGYGLRLKPSEGGPFATHTYLGCVAAVSREAFLEAGGYREDYVHSGEEVELCIRLMMRGWVVRLGAGGKAIHHRSDSRRSPADLTFACRNELLIAFEHAPVWALPRRLARISLACTWRALHHRAPRAVLRGVTGAFRLWSEGKVERRPVPRRVWKLQRRMEHEARAGHPRTLLADAVAVAESVAPAPK